MMFISGCGRILVHDWMQAVVVFAHRCARDNALCMRVGCFWPLRRPLTCTLSGVTLPPYLYDKVCIFLQLVQLRCGLKWDLVI